MTLPPPILPWDRILSVPLFLSALLDRNRFRNQENPSQTPHQNKRQQQNLPQAKPCMSSSGAACGWDDFGMKRFQAMRGVPYRLQQLVWQPVSPGSAGFP